MKNPISVFQFLPATVLLLCAGCYSGTPDRVNPPDVDPGGAAKKAMDQYDTNNDGQLSAEELVACPAILKDLEFFDANSDGNVSDDEIKARIQSWHDSRTGIMSFSCTVNLGGNPLVGAVVKFVPESFLGDAVIVASGTTEVGGMAIISIADEDAPENLKGIPGLTPGIYRVEITHPTTNIPAKYNTETTLGQEVSQDNPSLQTGVEFNLSAR